MAFFSHLIALFHSTLLLARFRDTGLYILLLASLPWFTLNFVRFFPYLLINPISIFPFSLQSRTLTPYVRVLLSLVRSNAAGNIGFLEVENRVCVALSRARRGLFIFGDAPKLCKSSMLWWHVLQAIAIGYYLHLTCKKHNEKVDAK